MCGPSNSPRSDAAASLFQQVGIAAHIADSGHAVRNVEGIDRPLIPNRRQRAVHVHVPEAGDQVFAGGVDDDDRLPVGSRSR